MKPTKIFFYLFFSLGLAIFPNLNTLAQANTTDALKSDVNGDGYADIIAFGNTNVIVSLGRSDGTFSTSINALTAFTKNSGGWTSFNEYPRIVGDVNGDGRADIVGFGNDNVLVALGRSDGKFDTPQAVLSNFTKNGGGWTSFDEFPRLLSDVNGDNRADIVAFGSSDVFIAFGRSDGKFDTPQAVLSNFTKNNGGWTSFNEYPRTLADVNGDGRADIVGFGNDNVLVAFGRSDGKFEASIAAVANFTKNSGGWTSFDTYPRMLGSATGSSQTSTSTSTWRLPWSNGVTAKVSQTWHGESSGYGVPALDIALGAGQPVLAPIDSKVVSTCNAGNNHRAIKLQASNGQYYSLIHVRTDSIWNGKTYKQGEKIGVVASDLPKNNCATSYGVHLHFGLPTKNMSVGGYTFNSSNPSLYQQLTAR